MMPLEAYPAWMPGPPEAPEHVVTLLPQQQAPLAHRVRVTAAVNSREPIRDFENEVELMSSMHVTWFSSMQCEAAYGFPRVQSAPSLQTTATTATTAPGTDDSILLGLSSMYQSALNITNSSSSVNWPESPRALAACLATPIEPPTELPERPRNRLTMPASNAARAR